ncbi:MAG: MlaD family protein [Rhodococcus sp. (in: high G+C Gram-positive bacteria)]
MKAPVATLLKLGAFAVVALLCLVMVGGALRNGGSGDRSSFDATFGDVSGLYEGDDVRMSGVLVGQVTDIELDENNLAKVDFEIDSNRPVTSTTKAAVRYQNLLGQRYLEMVTPPGDSGSELPSGSSIGKDMTIPSFDITTLFDGFQPIFETLEVDQVNKFAQNVLDLVQGDGSGLGPVLADLDGLTTYAALRG